MPRPQSVFEGETYRSSKFGEYLIKEYRGSKDIIIQFKDTGYSYSTHSNVIRMDLVKDPYAKTAFGVGYYGEPPVSYKDNRKPHDTWWNMMVRCYDKESIYYENYGERGVRVAEEWHNYANFCQWYLDNYIEGCQLEKDILSGVLYSPDTCLMVPQRLNACIAFKKTKRSNDGVSEIGDTWVAQYHIGEGRTKSKSFRSKAEALVWYRKNKLIWVRKMINTCYREDEIDRRVRRLCLDYVDRLEESYAKET